MPVINVTNNGATGGTGVYLGHKLVKGGVSECCLVVGFEKMWRGSWRIMWEDRVSPLNDLRKAIEQCSGV